MAEQQINPYASPQELQPAEQDAIALALRPLRGPSLGLLITGATWGGFGLVALFGFSALAIAVYLFEMNHAILPPSTEVWRMLCTLPSCFIAYGARCMRRGVRYRLALVASVLACVPMISPWLWIGIPFGIWALIVLRRKDVRAAFHSGTSTKY